MPLPHRRTALALVALAPVLAGIGVAVAGAQDDAGPRNPAAEAASGNPPAMRAVVQDAVDCLRARGFHPGDAQIQGSNVVIADWNPPMDSAAGRATEECSFPVR
jgi:hypothetical protein